ncbi:Hypothetical predicted protein [Pelobates cultripes]|uniref:Uncharacterized protein n=1 Tax=Pelobates cultripes TaxID=61616 RepID=A0AAD1R803_PELCU|nr:Hypothetical predicted protein [Pelobates cultripes]
MSLYTNADVIATREELVNCIMECTEMTYRRNRKRRNTNPEERRRKRLGTQGITVSMVIARENTSWTPIIYPLEGYI